MGKKPKIYTKTGDDGTTGLFGGTRIKKDDSRLEAYGTLDELNAHIGLIRYINQDNQIDGLLVFIQEKLFSIGAVLASDEKGKKITGSVGCSVDEIAKLENAIDFYEQDLPELRNFLLPGSNQLSAYCHVARAVCRRAERRIVALGEKSFLPQNCHIFINRLSDFLFILSRKAANDGHSKELNWRLK